MISKASRLRMRARAWTWTRWCPASNPRARTRAHTATIHMSDAEREQLAEGSLISHLIELRDRLLRSVIVVGLVFIPCAIYANDLFTLIAPPLREKMPEGTSIIATSLVAPFMGPFKLAVFVALFIAMPYVLYQAWAFVAPGLYKHEKRYAVP